MINKTEKEVPNRLLENLLEKVPIFSFSKTVQKIILSYFNTYIQFPQFVTKICKTIPYVREKGVEIDFFVMVQDAYLQLENSTVIKVHEVKK